MDNDRARQMPPDDVGNYSRDRYRARVHDSSRTSRSPRQEAHVGQVDRGVRHADAGHERVAVQGSSSRFSAASSHSRTVPPGRSVHQDASRLQARSRHHDAYMSGTTSYSPPPRGKRPHRVQSHPIAVTGEPDTSLRAAAAASGGCSGMYSRALPSPLFTGQRFSLQVPGCVTSSLHHDGNLDLLGLL